MKKHLAMLVALVALATFGATRPTSAGSPKASIDHQGTHATVAIGFADCDIGTIGTTTDQRMLVTHPAIGVKKATVTTPTIATLAKVHEVASPAGASRARPSDIYITTIMKNVTSPLMAIARGTPDLMIITADTVAIITPEVARSGPIVVCAPFGSTAFART